MRLPVLLLFCLLALPARAEDFLRAPLLLEQAGVICGVDSDGRAPAPETEAGEILLIDQAMEIDVETARVPARLGLSFGWRLRLQEGVALSDLTMVVRHPPLGLRGLTEQRWPTEITDQATSLDLFKFEHPHELTPGPWIFELHQGEAVLARHSFEVVPEWEAIEVIEACFGLVVS